MRRVRAYGLFWKGFSDLGSKRGRIRPKLADFLSKKIQTGDPVSGLDRRMSGSDFKNVWHFHLSRNPDVVLFYEQDAESVNLLMLGSHHDYNHGKGNRLRQEQTVERLENARAAGTVDRPGWRKPNWKTFEDVLSDPDIEGVDSEELEALIAEIDDEMANGERFMAAHGHRPDIDEETLDRFIADGDAAIRRAERAARNRMTPGDVLMADETPGNAPKL